MKIFIVILFLVAGCFFGKAQKQSIPEAGSRIASNGKGFTGSTRGMAKSSRTEDALKEGAAGYANMREGNYNLALKNFEKAIGIYKELNVPDSLYKMYLNASGACTRLANMPLELEYLLMSIEGNRKIGNAEGLAMAHRNLGIHYMNLGQWSKAAEYFEQALIFYQQMNNQKEVGNTYGNLGHAYGLVPDPAKQLSSLQSAMAINRYTGNIRGLGSNYWILSEYYKKVLHDYKRAYEALQQAYALYKEAGSKSGMAEALILTSDLYKQAPDSVLQKIGITPAQKYLRAIELQKESVQHLRDINQLPRLSIIYRTVSETYEKLRIYDSALHYYRLFIDLRESMLNIGQQKELTRIETKYEYEKREDSIRMEQQLSNQQLAQQEQELKLKKGQLDLLAKEKEIQKLAVLKLQTELENETLVKLQKEKENQLKTEQVKSLMQGEAILKLNQQKKLSYFIGGFVMIILLATYFLYKFRMRSLRLETQLVKEKAIQETREAAFQFKLADVSMSALRSQMNPHFIFNCLNSIKLYTTQNDTASASAYLTKFSKLIRLVLDNSRNERISLSSELNALELYIQMEAMRFKEKLKYSLVVNKNVELDYIEIPPLLLQPYVENAIWHGLMPKEEGGHIAIQVSLLEKESILDINITDNGIGRKAAKAIKIKAEGKHHSYGMQATTERIELINQVYKTGASVIIKDLEDNEGLPAGTQVNIQIPV